MTILKKPSEFYTVEYGLTTVKPVTCITLVVIDFGLTIVELASCMTPMVIECGLTTVVLVSCIMKTG